MSKRWTFLIMDEETGKKYVGVREGCPHIHNDNDVIRLFAEENKQHNECEVRFIEAD